MNVWIDCPNGHEGTIGAEVVSEGRQGYSINVFAVQCGCEFTSAQEDIIESRAVEEFEYQAA
jgi:hypothetical protein